MPTYSIEEVINLIDAIDNIEELENLASILLEDKKRYPLTQLRAIAVLLSAKRASITV